VDLIFRVRLEGRDRNENAIVKYKVVYATAFIEQMATLPLTCSSTILTTKVDVGKSKIQALGLNINLPLSLVLISDLRAQSSPSSLGTWPCLATW